MSEQMFVDDAEAVLRELAARGDEYDDTQAASGVILDELARLRGELDRVSADERQARAALARRDATIAAVRALCEDLQVEDINGGMTNADSLWPSEVLELLSAPVEAGATEPPRLVAARDGKAGCPETRWDGPYNYRCGLGIDECARHGRFAARTELVEAGTPAEPGYQRIADAIEAACDAAALALTACRDGVPVEGPYLRVARVLDKAGLIDWSAFAGAPAEPTSDTEEPT